MPPKYRDADWLVARYHGDGWTQREMADACGVSPRTIRTWMDRHDIETRDVEGENHPLYGETRDESVRERISETMEGREVSEDTRERMSESHVGNEVTEAAREKISRALEGRKKSAETRAKMSKSRLGLQSELEGRTYQLLRSGGEPGPKSGQEPRRDLPKLRC